MPRKAKGLTRKITRKQARSYDRTVPNPGDRPRAGVTHLAVLNGDGAYDEYHERYAATRDLLANAEAEQVAYTQAQRRAMKKMSPARRAAFKRMLAASPDIKTIRSRRRKKNAAKKTRSSGAKRSAAKRRSPASRSYAANRRKKTTKKKTTKRKLTKAERRAIALRNLRKAHKARGTKMRRGRQTRSYGQRKSKKTGRKTGGYKALRARYGPRSRWTYKYATRKGQVRDIPDFALLGYPSAAAMRQVYRTGSERERAALSRKIQKLYDRRERAADRSAARIRAGRGMFTPNAEDVLSYEEWEEMRPNARRRRKKSYRSNKKMTKAQRSAAAKKGWRKRRRGHQRPTSAKKRTTKRTAKRRTSSRRPKFGTKAYYRWLGKKGAAARRRKSGSKKKTRSRRGKRVTGKSLVVYVKNRRRRRARRNGQTAKQRAASLRNLRKARAVRRRGGYRRNQGAYAVNRGYTTNRRRRRTRRSYRKNQGYMAELAGALKLGALVTAGFATHRALTHVVDVHLLGKVDALTTGSAAPYRPILSGFLTAALGIGATMALPLKNAKAPIAAGMAASFIHGAVVTALNAAGAGEAAAYFANYPNAEGSVYGHGIGSYYEFKPHQVYSGYGRSPMGSYYEIPQPGVAGFGQAPMLTQAAAGLGRAPMLTQAAAGYGQPALTQAAAGYGQPVLTQAAAGTGEYVAYGAHAIGEYDEQPVSMMATPTDEGIYPNLHSAEQAISAAEAVAGVGSAEVPLQSTVNPVMIADPIAGAPGGSRAGVFQGGDGIFG